MEQPHLRGDILPATAATQNSHILLVFIHGFKGSAETTFEDFPNRLAHLVRETHPGLAGVTPLVYPTYDTRGQLSVAVDHFVGWLAGEVGRLEAGYGDAQEGFVEKEEGPAGKGSVKVVLCGHSMGGLVAVDAALRIAQTRSGTTPGSGSGTATPTGEKGEDNGASDAPFEEMWPHVVSVIAYDSPFYGVHPNVFRNQASKYISYAQHARDLGTHFAPLGAGLAAAWGMGRGNAAEKDAQNQGSSSRAASAAPTPDGGGWGRLTGLLGRANTNTNVNSAPPPAPSQQGRSSSAPAVPTTTSKSSSGWNTALWATGVLATAATATGIAAYMNRDQINGAYSYLTDHFEYVSNLWDDKALRERLDTLISLPSVLFHAYYNHLPATHTRRARTFIVLPPRASRASPHFTPLQDPASPDEVSAHIGMFNPASAAYPVLGMRSAEVLGEVVRSIERVQSQSQGQDQVPGRKTRRRQGVDMREGQRRMETPAPGAATSGAGATSVDADEDQGLRSGDAGLEEQEEELARRFKREREEAEAMDRMASQHSAD